MKDLWKQMNPDCMKFDNDSESSIECMFLKKYYSANFKRKESI